MVCSPTSLWSFILSVGCSLSWNSYVSLVIQGRNPEPCASIPTHWAAFSPNSCLSHGPMYTVPGSWKCHDYVFSLSHFKKVLFTSICCDTHVYMHVNTCHGTHMEVSFLFPLCRSTDLIGKPGFLCPLRHPASSSSVMLYTPRFTLCL